MIEVIANKSHIYISSSDSSSTIKKNEQEMNHSMDSAIIKSMESPIPKIVSQLSNIVDKIPIQPYVNFLISFKQNFIPGTAPTSLSITSFKNSY